MHRTVKYTLLAATAFAAFAAPVRAQVIMSDPAHTAATLQGWILQFANTVKSLANEAKQIANQEAQLVYDGRKLIQLVRTADAVIHGNYYAAADLIPELQALGLIDPWDTDAAALQELFTGTKDLLGAGGAIAGQAGLLRDSFQFYRPGGSHYGAVALNGFGNSSAAHMAAANRMMAAAQDRSRKISALKGRVGTAADVTDAANAGARMGLETATNTAQTTMAVTAMHNQQVQRDVREVQGRAAWLASVEQLRADAETAYANAKGGRVDWQTGTGIRRIAYTATSSGVDTADATEAVGQGGVAEGGGIPAVGGGSRLDLLASREWGDAAFAAADRAGITRESMASACYVESNCTDVAARPRGTIEGPWQVKASTGEAAAARAGLSGYDNSDPAQQAAAAAEEMRSIGTRLQNAGIQPTALNVRAGYQFGPGYAVALNTASPDTPMSAVLTSYGPDVLKANGVANMTVGQWRASVANRLGAGANTSIFTGVRT